MQYWFFLSETRRNLCGRSLVHVLDSRRYLLHCRRGFVGDADALNLPLAANRMRYEKRTELTVSKGLHG